MPETFRVLLGLVAAHVCGDAFIYSRFVSGLKRSERASSRVAATALHCLFHAVFVFFAEHLDEVVTFGDGVASSCLSPLTATARAKVCDMIEERWDDDDEE